MLKELTLFKSRTPEPKTCVYVPEGSFYLLHDGTGNIEYLTPLGLTTYTFTGVKEHIMPTTAREIKDPNGNGLDAYIGQDGRFGIRPAATCNTEGDVPFGYYSATLQAELNGVPVDKHEFTFSIDSYNWPESDIYTLRIVKGLQVRLTFNFVTTDCYGGGTILPGT